MYVQRLRNNISKVILEHGFRLDHKERSLQSVSARHVWNIERGLASVTIEKLEEIADEIGADMMDFFK